MARFIYYIKYSIASPYYLVMIKIRPTKKFWNSHTIHPLTLILAIMISCCSSTPVVPFLSHQFQLTCSPVLTGIGTSIFNVTLPTSYNSTFSRYLVLSGFQANLRDKVSFQASLTNNTATMQSITVLNWAYGMEMVLLSVQIVFISTNDWIWAMSSTYSCNSIRNYYNQFAPMSEDNYVTPIGGIINNPTQYKIIPLISFFDTASWKWLDRTYGPPNIVKFTASILSASSVKLTFRRQYTYQFVYQVGYVLLFYNTTQLQIQNFIYKSYSVTSTTAFNQPPNSSYVSSTFGGFQGNCLIGIFNIKLSGQWLEANRGPTFSKTSPISNIVNNKQSSDQFSVTYNALCFTGQTCHSPLPSPLIFNPSLQQCILCSDLIRNCSQCTTQICTKCMPGFRLSPSLQQCILCSDLIRNCSQCTTQICTKCMPGFRLSSNSKSCNCLMGVYKNGVCNTIKGCAKPFQYSNGSIGCLQCQQPDFFIVPVYDHCECRKGIIIGDYCSQIKNCIAALISSNGSIYCAFCNITAGFYYLPQNLVECVCAEHLVSNGTHCNDICGDGFLMNSSSKDNCDDGNTINGDGCNENCIVQPLYRCQNGSKTQRSKCYYIGGKATVNLSKISKTWNQNQATFEFEINPKISGLSQMDYSSLLNLTCDSDYSISGYTYSQGILAVKVDYNQNMENVACNLTLDFDRNIIRSPSAKLSFNAKSSNYPLFYSIFLQSLTKIQLSFQLLSFIVLGSFVLSIGHKLIGAQLLICCQIVYLSNCFYKIPSMYLNPIKQFKFVTGDWSLFHKKQYLQMAKPFSQRVEMSAYFMENTLFVISILLFLLAITISIFLFSLLKRKKSIASQSKIPLVKKTFQSKDYQKNQLSQKQIKMKERPVQLQKFVDSLAFKALRLIFRTLFFPIVTGYFIIIVISSYIHNNNFDSKNLGEFHIFLNAGAELFAWIILGTIISFQVFGSLVQGNEIVSKLVGQQNTKGWYINVFIFRSILVAILIELGIIYSYDFLIYVLGIVELGYMVILIFFRGYTTILDNVGVVSCLITECFAIALPIISRSLSISEISFVIMIYLLIGMLFFSIIVTNIRNYFVIKNAIVELIKFCKRGKKSKQKQKRSQDELNQVLYENKQKYHLFMKPTDEIDYINQDLNRIQTFKQNFMRDLMVNKQKRNSPLVKFESIHMEHQEQKNINLEEQAEFRQTKERLREDFKKKIKNVRFNQSMKLTSL